MLISTKIKAPPLKSHLLLRWDLITRLCTANRFPFILLLGPAGSGKTTLTCQWIKAAGIKVAWYSLDQEDNDADLFFRYLLTVLIHADEGLKESFGPMLDNRQRLDGKIVIPHIIECLSGSGRDLYLVLDDFHHIENKDILNAVVRLMQHPPSRLHLVILSRYSPPVSVASVVYKSKHLKLTDSDLKFTETESTDFLKKIIPGHFSPDQIRELNRYFEGWATGLQLAGLLIRSKGHEFDLSYILNQTHEKVTSYLIHDILRGQSEKIRNFVSATTLLDRFNPDLCNEVTGRDDAVRILARIERMNLFLIPLDTQGRWYRYHHMFSEALRRQTAIYDPGLILPTLRKAATWFAANNHLEDAIRSAFRSGDFEFAADLMENYVTLYVTQLNPNTGLRWILRLPSEILKKRTLLKLHQCNFLLLLTELSDLKNILTSIEEQGTSALARYSGNRRVLCKDFTIYLKCMLYVLHAHNSVDNAQFQTLRKKISVQNKFFLIGIEFILVLTLITEGRLRPAEASFKKFSQIVADYNLSPARIFSAQAKALIARHQGRLRQAERIIIQTRQEFKNTSIAYNLLKILGHIYYLQNKLTEAQECATLVARYCQIEGLIHEILQGNELQLLLHIAAGEKEKASQSIQQMRAYAIRAGIPQITACAEAWAARLAVEEKSLASAISWSKRRDLKTDEPFSLIFALECLTQARLYYAKGKYDDTVLLLKTLRNRCLKRSLRELVLQIDVLHCAALHAMRQHKKSAAMMKKALVFAETEGYIRPFIDDSALILPILKGLEGKLNKAALTAHLQKIFVACNISHCRPTVSSKRESSGPADLTLREIEILEWMSKGLQNKEIAQNTFISANTVKTHVRKILAKLNAQTRTQATIKAKKLGIIK